MKKNILAASIAALAMGASLQVFAEEAKQAQSIMDAVKSGTTKISLRYRYENVDEDNIKGDGTASTLKSRLTFTTAKYNDFQAQIEIDDVTALGSENYDDFHNDNTDRSVIADTEGTDVNQGWLAYTGFDNTTLKAGRQRILLDNQRFVGGVGWRQNEQTYDSFVAVNTSLADTTIIYAYVDNVNRIFGPDKGRTGTPAAIADMDSSVHALNVTYSGLDIGKLTGYAYQIDVDEEAPGASNNTFGLRLVGSQKSDDVKFLYEAEYAVQSEHDDDSAAEYDADYYHLMLGATVSGITAKIGQEVLESDGGVKAFQTPLATLHKFNGWADQFLGTPATGIEDTYVSLSTSVMGVKLSATYHEFDANEGSLDHGDELDIAISKKVTDNVKVLLKYADYNADNWKVDTQKLWFQVAVSF